MLWFCWTLRPICLLNPIKIIIIIMLRTDEKILRYLCRQNLCLYLQSLSYNPYSWDYHVIYDIIMIQLIKVSIK